MEFSTVVDCVLFFMHSGLLGMQWPKSAVGRSELDTVTENYDPCHREV